MHLGSLLVDTAVMVVKFTWELLRAFYNTFVPTGFRKKDINNEIVLITGAGHGIGREMAIKFAQLGCHVVLWDIDDKLNEKTTKMVKDFGGWVTAYTCDVSDRKQVYETAEKVKSEVGHVDILVNNAAIVSAKYFIELTDEDFTKIVNTNLMSNFWTVKTFLPSMMERNHGHIVTVSSAAALVANPKESCYTATKAAQFGFDNALKMELRKLGKDGVHTTVVMQTIVDTGMFEGDVMKYPSYVFDILKPEYSAQKIVEAVLTNQQVHLQPRIYYVFAAMKWILPGKCFDAFTDVQGLMDSADNFHGSVKK